jgi:hypothetical protein
MLMCPALIDSMFIYTCCEIITERRAVTGLRHSKQLINLTTIAHATEELCFLCCPLGSVTQLLEAVFSMLSAPRL